MQLGISTEILEKIVLPIRNDREKIFIAQKSHQGLRPFYRINHHTQDVVLSRKCPYMAVCMCGQKVKGQ